MISMWLRQPFIWRWICWINSVYDIEDSVRSSIKLLRKSTIATVLPKIKKKLIAYIRHIMTLWIHSVNPFLNIQICFQEILYIKSFKNFHSEIIRIISIWDPLCDLVPLVQFKKREKHPWRNLSFSKVVDWNVWLH